MSRHKASVILRRALAEAPKVTVEAFDADAFTSKHAEAIGTHLHRYLEAMAWSIANKKQVNLNAFRDLGKMRSKLIERLVPYLKREVTSGLGVPTGPADDDLLREVIVPVLAEIFAGTVKYQGFGPRSFTAAITKEERFPSALTAAFFYARK